MSEVILEKENKRLPRWLYRQLAPVGSLHNISNTLSNLGLNTICETALCPNRHECWLRGTATFMILGNICTRDCGFCAVKTGIPKIPDPHEPEHLAQAVRRLELKHVVLTSVARDDLVDEGAGQFVEIINKLHSYCPNTRIEILIPDFHGRWDLVDMVLSAGPDILNHNIETVRRLTSLVRDKADYIRSLELLSYAKEYFRKNHRNGYTKSGLMLGLGENEDELLQTMQDLRKVDCDILTIGQYIQPTLNHLPVIKYHSPAKFQYWSEIGYQLGFKQMVSSPLARSSYHAEQIFLNN